MDEEDSDDLLSPGTRDTRQLETTFVKYQEFFSLNTLLVLMLKLKTTMMLVISKIIIFMLKGIKRSFAT